MTNIILPDAKVSNITISPTTNECLFIKHSDGTYKPVLIKDVGGKWKINDDFK
jgi:hypothetical protein